MIILKTDDRLSGRIVSGFKQDAVRLMGDYTTVDNVSVIDLKANGKAHRDGFQLIPASINNKPNQQYAAGVMKHPRIINSSVYSSGALQGIFCSDGILEEVRIRRNVIDTCSAHSITLNGVMSGAIKDNCYGDGSPLLPVLNNLRIGGGIANIWINSFKDHAYEKIQGEVIDNRGKRIMRGRHVDNFDLDLFNERKREIEYTDVETYCKALGKLATQCGRAYK